MIAPISWRCLILAAAAKVAVAVWLVGCGAASDSKEPAPASQVRKPQPATSQPAKTKPAKPRRGRPAVTADAELVAAARRAQGSDSDDGRCGPYALVTDVRDQAVLDDCHRLASVLDDAYRQTLGVKLVGRPAEVILLFRDRSAYRAFTAEQAGVAQGNAGYADGSRGYLAMPVGEQPRRKVRATLTHELSHLLHRRALGPNLPPWLSEGLADVIGDAGASDQLADVLAAPRDPDEAKRLRWGYKEGQVGAVQRLVALRRSEFDRQPVSYDYEQSAALARLLLTDPRYSPGFKKYLRRLSRRGPYDPAKLSRALGATWNEIDAELRQVAK